MKQLVSLLALALTATSVMASDTNDIWSYQDSDGTTLAQACNNKRTCELIYKNSHYLALVNNRSQTGCATGDLLVAEHASRSFKKLDTGTCSASASIEVNTYNRLNNVDIMVGDRLIKRYPLDAWKWEEIRKEGKKPSWNKAEENAATEIKLSYWTSDKSPSGSIDKYELLGNVDTLQIRCSEEFMGRTTPGKISLYHNGNKLSDVSTLNVDGNKISPHASNKDEWDSTVRALFNASKITYQNGQSNITIYADKKVLPNNFKCDYSYDREISKPTELKSMTTKPSPVKHDSVTNYYLGWQQIGNEYIASITQNDYIVIICGEKAHIEIRNKDNLAIEEVKAISITGKSVPISSVTTQDEWTNLVGALISNSEIELLTNKDEWSKYSLPAASLKKICEFK
ncbi:TPA: hypothetical protein SIA32_003325 [Aeromonas sobria]|nr:hypothetical protein [Aeromonas sobria]